MFTPDLQNNVVVASDIKSTKGLQIVTFDINEIKVMCTFIQSQYIIQRNR